MIVVKEEGSRSSSRDGHQENGNSDITTTASSYEKQRGVKRPHNDKSKKNSSSAVQTGISTRRRARRTRTGINVARNDVIAVAPLVLAAATVVVAVAESGRTRIKRSEFSLTNCA